MQKTFFIENILVLYLTFFKIREISQNWEKQFYHGTLYNLYTN